MSTYSTSYDTAYDKLRDLLALLRCLSELIDYPPAASELKLSIEATIGMSLILEKMSKEGWEALELFEEAWQEKKVGEANV